MPTPALLAATLPIPHPDPSGRAHVRVGAGAPPARVPRPRLVALATIAVLCATIGWPAGGVAAFTVVAEQQAAVALPIAAPGTDTAGHIDIRLGDRLAALVNQLRLDSGRVPVVVDVDGLGSVAEARATTMVKQHEVAPAVDADGLTVYDLLAARGIAWAAAGEAVSWSAGGSGVDPLNGLLVGLLAKPASRALLLAPSATHLAVSVGIVDDQGSVRLPDDAGTIPPAPRVAIASLIVITKDGPSAPILKVAAASVKSGSGTTITVRPDGSGRLSVVITDRAGELLAIVAWNRQVSGRTVLRWDGRIGGNAAAPGTYEVRAFTVNTADLASDPSRVAITINR